MKSLTKNQRYIAIGALAFVVLAVACINFMLGQPKQNKSDILNPSPTATSEDSMYAEFEGAGNDYFAVFRADRDDVRTREMQYLDTIINSEVENTEALKAAQEQKLDLITAMEKEVIIEGLLKAKGFTNAAVTISSGSVNAIIDKGQLTDSEVAQVLDITRRETGEAVQNIKVLPLNYKY